jgi:hypothetical protein
VVTVPPTHDARRRTTAAGLRAPVLVGVAGLGAALLLHLRDPHDAGTYGYCPFLELTGKPCPGCGGLRAVNDLTRGDVVGAVSSNAVAVALVLAVGVAWIVWLVRRLRGRDAPMLSVGVGSGLAVLGVFLLFGVVRNTPWGSWLAP